MMLISGEMMGNQTVEEANVPHREPIIDAEATPRRVRNAINRGDIAQQPAWMDGHNASIARAMLREPPQDKI